MKTKLLLLCLLPLLVATAAAPTPFRASEDIFKELAAAQVELDALIPEISKVEKFLKDNPDVNTPLPEDLAKIVEKKGELYKVVDGAFHKFKALPITLKKKPAAADWHPADSAKLLDYYLLFSAHADSANSLCADIYAHLQKIMALKAPVFVNVIEKDNHTKSAVKACMDAYKAEFVDGVGE